MPPLHLDKPRYPHTQYRMETGSFAPILVSPLRKTTGVSSSPEVNLSSSTLIKLVWFAGGREE